MTTLTANITTFAYVAHVFKDAIVSMKDSAVKSRLLNATTRELNALSNRELSDLGISRGSISTVAHQAVYGV